MTGRPPVGVSAAILLDGLRVFEAAARAVSADTAVRPVRRAVRGLSDDQLRAAAVVLAVEGVWGLPPLPPRVRVGPLTADEVSDRQAQIRDWASVKRLEALWLLS